MYKIILFAFFISLSMAGQSIEFERIGKTDSLAKKEILFNRLSSKLIELIGGQAKYDKSIIQSDKELGVIKFKQELNYVKSGRSDNGVVKYNVSVFFKDEKFKIIFNDFFHEGMGISLMTITQDEEYPHEEKSWVKFRKRAWKELKTYINTEIPPQIYIIEKIIKTPTELEKDW
jgi:hypothetical protein